MSVLNFSLDTKTNLQFGFLKGTKFYNNSATVTGGAIRTFFDYSLIKEDLHSPAIFIGNDGESSAIFTSRPSYYLISCYEPTNNIQGDMLLKGDFRKLEQNINQAVLNYYLVNLNC